MLRRCVAEVLFTRTEMDDGKICPMQEGKEQIAGVRLSSGEVVRTPVVILGSDYKIKHPNRCFVNDHDLVVLRMSVISSSPLLAGISLFYLLAPVSGSCIWWML